MLAVRHGVSHLLLAESRAGRIRSTPGGETVLSAHWQQQQARSLLVISRLKSVLEACERWGVEVLPWKGPLLSHRLFGSMDLRESRDIDLIAPPSSWVAARSLLESLGFEASPAAEAELERGCHCLPLREESTGLFIELHRSVAESWYPVAIDLERVAARTELTSVAGVSFRRLHARDELLFLCVHGARHNWSSLIWILDLAVLIKNIHSSDADMDEWIAEWRRERVLRLVAASAALVRDVFGVDLPKQLAALSRQSTASRLARRWKSDLEEITRPPAWKSRLRKYRRLSSSREWLKDRLSIWREGASYLLLPNQKDFRMARKYRLPEACAVLLRPWRLLVRYRR